MLLASKEPALSLKDRLRLANVTIWFRFDSLTTLCKATGIDVATRSALVHFIQQQIAELSHDNPGKKFPDVAHWRILREDRTQVDLASWNPQDVDGYTFLIEDDRSITQDLTPSMLMLRHGFENNRGRTLSFDGAYQVISGHLLLVILKTTRALSKKKKKSVTSSTTTTIDVLVPGNLTLGRLLQETGTTLGNTQEKGDPFAPQTTTNFDTQDLREVGSFGWSHGKRLRVWDEP
ncbi:MAG: hypothetical protein Q9179_006129 [Wetmoreana sp. 5 TL-2023]